MQQAGQLEQKLLKAGSVADVLAAGWEIFELVRVIAAASAGQAADMYPAFTFARGAAVSGRNALAFAPSMPAGPGASFESLAPPACDVQEIADAVAGLASALSARLRETAAIAADAGDRSACEDAADDAERIIGLLAGSA